MELGGTLHAAALEGLSIMCSLDTEVEAQENCNQQKCSKSKEYIHTSRNVCREPLEHMLASLHNAFSKSILDPIS
jgi:hypothetical protein